MAEKWFPHRPTCERETAEAIASAQFLEQQHWDNFTIAVANGIAKAFQK